MNKSWHLCFVIWLISTVVFAIGGAAALNIYEYYLLSTRGVQTQGRITDTDPHNHRVVHYEYFVNQKIYKWGGYAGDINRNFENVKAGDKVPIVYDSINPEISCLGNPNNEFRSLTHGVIFISIFPTLALLSYKIRKNTSQRREVS